jgi:hypothetical protein
MHFSKHGAPGASSDLAGRTLALSPDAGLRHSLPVAVSAHDESTLKRLIAFGEIGGSHTADIGVGARLSPDPAAYPPAA